MKIFVVFFFSLFVFPMPAVLDATEIKREYEDLISIRVVNEQIDQVLQQIEEQTGYTIFFNSDKNHVVSINLTSYPVEKGIQRILSGMNYVINHDEAQKILTIQDIGKKGSRYSNVIANDNEALSVMDQGTDMLRRHSEFDLSGNELATIVDDSPMSGSSRAIDLRLRNNESEKDVVIEQEDQSPMAIASKYISRVTMGNSRGQEVHTVVDISPMSSASKAIAEHRRSVKGEEMNTEIYNDNSPMSAAVKALEGHKKNNNIGG